MEYSRSLHLLFAFWVLCTSLTACAYAPTTDTQPTDTPILPSTNTPIPPTEIPVLIPTNTPIPPSPTPDLLPVKFPKPGTVVLDFVALVCNARWTNGAFDLPCPGNRDNIAEGYISSTDNAVAEGMIPVAAPVLIALPGLGGEHGAGLFGHYPPLTIQSNDTFHAILACQENADCNVVFALNYFDTQGNYHHDTGWSWQHRFGDGPVPVQVDLSALAGQTVELTLVVLDQGTPQNDWVLWIYPYVARATK